ncbi:3',5'-cyclic AMP phosphodiesterase CpdA [Breznakia blatticola]|uniref:3',5'-cyclic AMP phosphodiesterase CpdA n=1 Tax=Breznakia blatticola TaxID=1754012 RepID=A0A4R7ZHX4_9FIRM|nr:LamG-like jellyroll fold domain-containing protein [Breznakia blatticola]TDW16845.1 3',5'-cyclic AMP phosphodiesterase CpdA [Breznakia blatticola]
MYKIIKRLFMTFVVTCICMTTCITGVDAVLLKAVTDEVLYVDFEGQVDDQSGNGNNGTLVGSPDFVSGIKGKAIHIKNAGSTATQYVNFGKPTDLQFGEGNFSYSLWYNSAGSNDDMILGNKDWNSGGNRGWGLATFSDGVRANIATNGRKDAYYIKVNDQKWHHIAVNYDRSGDMVVYVDGVEFKRLAINTLTGTTDSLDVVLGADGNKGFALADGYIDELRMFRRVMSAEEISEQYMDDGLPYLRKMHKEQYAQIKGNQEYNSDLKQAYKVLVDELHQDNLTAAQLNELTPKLVSAYEAVQASAPDAVPGLVLHTTFDDDTATDISGCANNGSVVGNPEYVTGVKGKAIHIQNTGLAATQYVNFGKPESLMFGEENFAYSLWYNSAGSEDDMILGNKDWNSGKNRGWGLSTYNNGVRTNISTTDRVDIREIKINDQKWHHIAVNHDRTGDMVVYIDGTEFKRIDISKIPGNVDVLDVVLGADGKKSFAMADGYIDELYMYNRLITQEEINEQYDVIKLESTIKKYQAIVAEAKTNGTDATKIAELEKAIQSVITIKEAGGSLDINRLVANLDIAYERFQTTETPAMSFEVISDPHIQGTDRSSKNSANLIDALEDIGYLNPTSSAVLYPGDLTDYGRENEYKGFYDIIENFTPQGTESFVTLGNHDVRWQPSGWEEAKARYLKYNKNIMGDTDGRVYYDKWIDGYHFISLSTESDLKDQATLSAEQLQWLDNKLSENDDPERPQFIIIHQTIKGTYDQADEDVIKESEEVKAVLRKHKNAVMFTGHIHNGIDLISHVNYGYGTQVDVPSFYYSSFGSKVNQVGYQVNVFDGGQIQIRLRDYKNDTFLDEYEMNFNIDDVQESASSPDVPTDVCKVTAGSEQSTSEDASKLIDDDLTTMWHSKYSNDTRENQYVIFELDKEMEVNGMRYVPRQSGINGKINAYEVYTSVNGTDYTLQTTGKWYGHRNTQFASFDPVVAKYVKLQVVSNYGPGLYSSATEMRVTQPKKANSEAFDALQEVIVRAKALIDANKEASTTKTSWTNFRNVYDEAVLVTSDAEDVAILDVTLRLETAMTGLVDRASTADFEALVAKITEYEALADKYSDAQFAGMRTAIGETKTLVAKGNADVSATDVANATKKLTDEKTKLDAISQGDLDEIRALLTTTIANATKTLEEAKNMRPSTVTAVESAITNGQSLLQASETNITILTDAIQRIVDAVAKLETIVDKTEITQMITLLEALTESDYTEKSWKTLQTAITNAKAVVANDDATTEDVRLTQESLYAALNGLEKVKVFVKDNLQKEIATAEIILVNSDKYVASSIKDLATAVATAKQALADATSQADIDAATKALMSVRLKARLKPDTERLENLLSKTADLDTRLYTVESVAALDNAITKVLSLLENEEATQAEIDAVYSELAQAMKNLVKQAPSTSPEQNKPNNTQVNNNGAGVNSGDTTDTTALYGLLVLALAGVALFGTRKYRQHK